MQRALWSALCRACSMPTALLSSLLSRQALSECTFNALLQFVCPLAILASVQTAGFAGSWQCAARHCPQTLPKKPHVRSILYMTRSCLIQLHFLLRCVYHTRRKVPACRSFRSIRCHTADGAAPARQVVLLQLPLISDEAAVKALIKKLGPPLVTLLSEEAEVQYVALRNINLIVQKHPEVLSHEIKASVCAHPRSFRVCLGVLQAWCPPGCACNSGLGYSVVDPKEFSLG